ncbi:MAG: hypothetical protein C5B49_01625 [Bdellovibrio sp.]|nr:MAG: hypothetical protein C5B49_01625 [Bdellovibrio sp.]
MMIYDTLAADHRAVMQLVDELIATPEGDEFRDDLVNQIRDELIPHSRAEEAVFYNSLRALDVEKDRLMHSFREHLEAETLLRTLQAKSKMDLETQKTARKLREALHHHIREEEGPIFTAAQETFTKEEAEMLGDAFDQLKGEVKPKGIMKTTIEFVANLMPARLVDTFRKGHDQAS